MLRGCTGNKYCSNESSFLRHCITILTLLWLLFNRLTYFRGGWGGDWSLGVLFYSCLTAWQRPLPNKCAREAEEEARWSFQNDSWLLAWVTSAFALCALGIGAMCPTLPPKKVIRKIQSEHGSWNTHRTRGSNPRTGSLSFPAAFWSAAEQLRVPRKATLQPCVCTRAQPGQHCSAAARTPTVCQIYSDIKLMAQKS